MIRKQNGHYPVEMDGCLKSLNSYLHAHCRQRSGDKPTHNSGLQCGSKGVEVTE